VSKPLFGRALSVSALLATVFASQALATTRSSFLDVTNCFDVFITQPTATTFQVTVGANPRFVYNSVTYTISSDIGFYLLSDDVDFSPLVSLATVGNFTNDSSNSGTGGIQGWRSNPNQGINPGETVIFTVPSNFDFKSVDRYGIHVRLASGNFPGTTGNTGNITGQTFIPTPGSAAMAAVGGLLVVGRRRRA
jgi:uncharacterized protein (TIGR03382 family)